jgi:amidohydrolase
MSPTSVHNRIKKTALAQFPDTRRMRRELHQHPDLSGSEQGTARRIMSFCKEIGLTPKLCVHKTGVAAEIRNGKGPTVVLRADIDALPITEINKVPFKSSVPGVMHACGHDMHTAALLGTAVCLKNLTDIWQGRVVLLFQPSEEVDPGGARDMITEKLVPADTIAILGLHVTTDHSVGSIGLIPGSDYSGVTDFDIVILGKGGHGALPETTIDPIVCAAHIITGLQSLVSREVCPHVPSVITIGEIKGGTRRNVIPDSVTLCGTLRTFSDDLEEMLIKRITDYCTATAKAHRALATFTFWRSYRSGFNNLELTNRAIDILTKTVGAKQVIKRNKPAMYSDDFSYFQRIAPGLYAHLGVRPPNVASAPGIHTPNFLPDENALTTATLYYVSMIADLLRK